ncbi:MAG TPA: NAD(P)-dependent oxidoreductase [Polyangiaceae bacterium]|jgi:D-3-phosphoglycerate dehydrogenase|nr:NAD(P)-dependent oxidoreductase [Polyangiaceae bacterium]
MRLLIADKLHPRAIDELRALPLEVEYAPDITSGELEERLKGFGILVVRSTPVTAKAIEATRGLNLIIRAGAQVQTIDVRAASRRGIYVANCPGKNATAVAELVYGMMIALDRRIVDATTSLRDHQWQRAEFAKAEGIWGKTIGIAGFGAIGREVALRARSFGLEPLAWGRALSSSRAKEAGATYVNSLDELASRSQILTLHLALNDRTRGIVSERVLAKLPRHAMLINTARADLVDHAAMLRAVRERALRVSLDVHADEPKAGQSFEAKGFDIPSSADGGFVYGTPHISASTDQAQLAIATETVRVIRSFLLEGNVPNVVNVVNASAARFLLVIRMMDKVGTFANVLNVIKRHGINIEEVANTVFDGSTASCAKLRVVSRPSEACLQEIGAFEEVLHVDVVTLPNLA